MRCITSEMERPLRVTLNGGGKGVQTLGVNSFSIKEVVCPYDYYQARMLEDIVTPSVFYDSELVFNI